MPSWVFNLNGDGGVEKLQPANASVAVPGSGMAGKLATNGNAVQAHVEAPRVKRTSFSPPGQPYSAVYSTGLERRIVRWRWAICAVSELALYNVEAVIARYIERGTAHTLSDGVRSNNFVILDSAQPLSPYQKTHDGRWRRVWMLEFHVLAPQTGGTQL